MQEMQERIISNAVRRTETPIKRLARHKGGMIHIDMESVKNKLLGASLIGIGIFSAELTGDGTAMIMLLFMGLAAISK